MPTSIAGIEIPVDIPNFTTGGLGFWIFVIIIGLLVIGLGGLIAWLYFQKKQYYIQIRDFENIAGKGFQLVKKDTARLVKVGDGGEELLLLRKRKVFRTAYGQKMGKNEYWFAKGQDGYWYNITLGDLDAKMGTLDIEPIDRDMRYMHVAIRKNIQERYKKEDRFSKYAPWVFSGIFLIIMIIAIWLLMSKAGDLIQSAEQTVSAVQPIADALTNAVSKLDSICGSSGVRPA